MKKYFFLSLLGITSVSAIAQKKNRIEVGVFHYNFAGSESQGYRGNIIDNAVVSLSYERALTNRFGVFVMYSGLPNNSNIGDVRPSIKLPTKQIETQFRNDFNYSDLGASYKLISIKRHKLATRMALSYAQGTEYTMTYTPLEYESYDWNCLGLQGTENEAKGYFGALAGIRYDYSFWTNRLNAGLNFDARQYAGRFPFQVNYGAHVGFNF